MDEWVSTVVCELAMSDALQFFGRGRITRPDMMADGSIWTWKKHPLPRVDKYRQVCVGECRTSMLVKHRVVVEAGRNHGG